MFSLLFIVHPGNINLKKLTNMSYSSVIVTVLNLLKLGKKGELQMNGYLHGLSGLTCYILFYLCCFSAI